MKDKYLTIRIDGDFIKDYKEMCEKNGYTQSKRIRALLELDFKTLSKKQNILTK